MCGSGGLIAKPCLTLETPHGLWPARRLCPWDLQSRILEWIVISFSRGSSQHRDGNQVSCTVDILY